MNRWGVLAAVLLALAGALALRLPRLELRPLHNDEAVNALKLAELWQTGRYRYDPNEFHGPTLPYLSAAVLRLSDAPPPEQWTEAHVRLSAALFGAGLVLLLALFADGLGRSATVWAAVFTAVSGPTLFYSRYFIHETLLVFFTTLALGAGWRWWKTRRAGWAVVTGLGVGLMAATKETFVLTLAAAAVALLVTRFIRPGGARSRLGRTLATDEEVRTAAATGGQSRVGVGTWRHLALGCVAAVAVWLVFFSSFFTNWRGLLDSVLTYAPWLGRARGDSPHIHPWYFYFERLAWFHPARSPVWTEALVLVLALVGSGVSWFGECSPLRRFLVVYTVALTAMYCVIPYKTPWCVLSFWQGMILLAGVGAATLLETARSRTLKWAWWIVLLAGVAHLAWQSCRGSFVWFADRRNPYVYAQTVPHLLKLVERVEAVAGAAPTGRKTLVQVVAPGHDYGPLPWYLRRLECVGWYDALPDAPVAPIVIVAARLDTRLDEKSDGHWIMTGLFEQRPGVFLELYVERQLWMRFVETLQRPAEAE